MAEFLDDLRDEVHAWTESLWDPGAGGFRKNADTGANLLNSTGVAWLRYATNDPDLARTHGQEWIRYLQRGQNPDTGEVSYEGKGQGHGNGHAFWHTVRALNIVGGRLLHFPHHLRPLMTVEGLNAWFDATDWDGPDSHHHEVLGLVPLLASLDDPAWACAFYGKIAEQQDETTATWPRTETSISRTFAYTAIHRATDRMPRDPEKIIDAMLSLQEATGFWKCEPRFATMDAAYVLVRLPRVTGHRVDESRQALDRLAEALLDFYGRERKRIQQDPHWMLAVVHTFGLLQEQFPDRFPSQRPYRFDWDKPSMYRCDVIAQAKRA